MFYCESCRKSYKYPEGFSKSYGRCEICKQTANCNDVASRHLPSIIPKGKSMKSTILALAVLSLTSCVQPSFAAAGALQNHNYHDTLQVFSEQGIFLYTGHITQLDKEDTIKQIEINDASASVGGIDYLFRSDFEYRAVNWIWVGDYSSGHEFGSAAYCPHEYYFKAEDGSQHVVLSDCFIFSSSEERSEEQ